MRPDRLHLQTCSASYEHALTCLARYAPRDWLPVLIQGETGTGKTWFARELHARSPRRARAYVAYNLAATDDALASSALFGHLPGAYTGAVRQHKGVFERAHGGTLCLDELAHASMHLQGMLLHAVERGEVLPLGAERPIVIDARLVAAIHRPARELMQEERLLPDLWHRLGVLYLRLPALRDRRSDILLLTKGIAERDAARFTGDARPIQFMPEVLSAFERAYWPGNVRQLEGIVQRLLACVEPDAPITMGMFEQVVEPGELEEHPTSVAQAAPSPGARARRAPRVTTERIVELLRDGHRPADAARRLGVDRATVSRHLAAARARGESLS